MCRRADFASAARLPPRACAHRAFGSRPRAAEMAPARDGRALPRPGQVDVAHMQATAARERAVDRLPFHEPRSAFAQERRAATRASPRAPARFRIGGRRGESWQRKRARVRRCARGHHQRAATSRRTRRAGCRQRDARASSSVAGVPVAPATSPQNPGSSKAELASRVWTRRERARRSGIVSPPSLTPAAGWPSSEISTAGDRRAPRRS